MRKATISRKTKETEITTSVKIDGTGKHVNLTGIGFLDHMLDLLAHHGNFDISVRCKGDLKVDDHHSVEDIAITLGKAFSQALKERSGIARYGFTAVPMDETLARCAVDLGGRSYLVFKAEFRRAKVGDLSTEMVKHFFASFAENIKANIHIEVLYGTNTHHCIEAIFKSFARALSEACARDARLKGIRSTKGRL
jgi:imidazoleglycerol-phosphate dehydratase